MCRLRPSWAWLRRRAGGLLRHLYLHGFASSADSRKGVHLARVLAGRGVELERLELNVPSFAELSPLSALAVVERAVGDDEVVLLGSSFGGWLAAIWAEAHPAQVNRAVLLCPGLDLAARWPLLIGADGMERWQARGSRTFDDARKIPTAVHWRFVEEARELPSWPTVTCPVLVLHGTRDEVVPFEGSARWVAGQPDARLIALDDDHALVGSLDVIAGEVTRFLALG